MIFTFVVDTSASMNRLFSNNLSYIECAKSGIEHFFKWEHSSSNRANNKYMLVTYEDQCYKTLLDTDNDETLLKEVKLLQATDISTAGATFGKMFEYLDLYRRTRNFDTIGRGRYPADAETTTIFWFTDGGHFAEKSAEKCMLSHELHIPQLQTPGQEFYIEPFRWDQRLFTLWMTENADPQNTVIQMSSVMRGEWWQIPNLKYLSQCIDNCMHFKHPNVRPFAPICNADGVLVNFVEHSAIPNRPIAMPETIMIYCNKSSTRHFPIPETYWADMIAPGADGSHNIPPRTAHPTILYTKRDDIYPIPEGFPVDRFSIDQRSDIVQELRKQKEKISWTLYMQFSGPNADIGAPFGTLKYSESSKTVSMYLMPYNFPVLFGHILELRKRGSASAAAQNISDYLRTVPIYYREPLHKAFTQINQLHLWPRDVIPGPNAHVEAVSTNAARTAKTMMTTVKNGVLAGRAEEMGAARGKKTVPGPIPVTSLFQSALDIPRSGLLGAIRDLRAAFGSPVVSPSPSGRQQLRLRPGIHQSPDDDPRFSVPMSVMGHYQPRMAKLQRLRDPLEDEETARQRDRNVFGNPYRQDKKISIDEEDEAAQMEEGGSLVSGSSGTSSKSTRRKRKLPPSAAGSETSELPAFNRAKVPALSGGRRTPLLDMPPALAWADIMAAAQSKGGSNALTDQTAERIALLAAYQPPTAVPEVEMVTTVAKQAPAQPMMMDGGGGRAPPLTHLATDAGQEDGLALVGRVSLSPISPDSPSEVGWNGDIQALRARIRKMVWCVPKDYKPDVLIHHLTQLDVEARRAVLPYALQCASACRRRALAEDIKAIASSLTLDADISMPPDPPEMREIGTGPRI